MEKLKPIISEDEVKSLIDQYYGLNVIEIQELNGYDDCNFFVKVNDQIKGSIDANFKVTNHIDSNEDNLLESLNDLILYVYNNGINTPIPLKNLNGNYLERIVLNQSKIDLKTGEKRKHAIRLFTFIPGILFQKVDYTKNLLENCATQFAKFNKILSNYSNKKIEERTGLMWALNRAPDIRQFLDDLENPTRKKMVEQILDDFKANVLDRKDCFTSAIIHDDLNEQNLIVKKVNETDYELAAILDFNDLILSIRIFDIAIFCAYCMLNDKCELKFLDMPKFILKSYISNIEVSKEELEIIPIAIKARLCQSLVLGAHFFKLDPTNHYLLTTAKTGWTVLEELHKHNNLDLIKMWLE